MKLPPLEDGMDQREYFEALRAEGVGVNEARQRSARAIAVRRVRNAGTLEELREAVADALDLPR